MRALITGITGFAGSHLADYLLAEHPDVEIYGTYRWRSRRDNLEHLTGRERSASTWSSASCATPRRCATRWRGARPTWSSTWRPRASCRRPGRQPNDTITSNLTGQTNLFEAFRAQGLDPVIQIACSSEEYGLVHPDETPIRETNPLRPLSPYAVSKVGQDYLGYQYFMSYGTKVIRTRGFNHTGPRRGDVFVTSNFARQVARIEAGVTEPVIRVGNLDAVRDFTDVRDMVRAYWLAVNKAKPGEVYNIATGNGITIREMLDRLVAMAEVEVTIETDPERLRPSDVEILIGDASKFKADTGWEPQVPFDKTLRDTLDFWRERETGKQAER